MDAAVEAMKANSKTVYGSEGHRPAWPPFPAGDEQIGQLIADAMEKVGARRRHHRRGVQDRGDLPRGGRGHAV